MLRIIQNTSSAGASSYYSQADYYTEGQELAGTWRGEGRACWASAGRSKRSSGIPCATTAIRGQG